MGKSRDGKKPRVGSKPEIGDYVLVPDSSILRGLVAIVVGFDGTKVIVQAVQNQNITVALGSKTRIVQERCTDPEHPDCLASEELGIDCARWTHRRLSTGARGGRK